MKDKPVVIGLDVGSSAIKIIAADIDGGDILFRERREYFALRGESPVPVSIYRDMAAEMLGEVLTRFRVKSVGVTTQMYSILEGGETPLAWQWNSPWQDSPEAAEFMAGIYRQSGCPPHRRFPLYKLMTLDQERRRAFLPYDVKAAIMMRLTGRLVTDYSTAASSGLFDTVKKDWNRELVSKLDLNQEMLPVALPHNLAAGELCIPGGEGVMVVPALGDGPSASFACMDFSDVCCNVGTSSAARTITKFPDRYLDQGLWRFPADGENTVVGDISAGCCSIIRAANCLVDMEKADIRSFKCGFWPEIAGGCPVTEDEFRACFAGTDAGAGEPDMAGAIYRAVAYDVCAMAERLMPEGALGRTVAAVGGGMHIPQLREVIMNCLPSSVAALEDAEYLAAEGAAMSAAEALGERLAIARRLGQASGPGGPFEQDYINWKNGPIAE